MSRLILTEITCWRRGCRAAVRATGVRAAVDAARAAGWKTSRNRDACPQHRRSAA